ncbi:nitrate/nitrite transporter [Microbacterium sp. NPDC089696]|uniref:MFS transporter n=1 Tax=Microbacterium sp. NPDC089696 TaxID=3364199 RepID=UPI003806075C
MNMSVTVAFGFLVVPGSAKFQMSAAQFLVFFTIFGVVLFVASPLAGRLMVAYGVRRVVLISGVIMTASLVLAAFAPNGIVLLISAVPFGIGMAGSTLLAGSTTVTGWFPGRRRGTMLGVAAMGTSLGSIFWGLLYPPVITVGGFTGGMLLSAVIVFACAVIGAGLLLRNPPAVVNEPGVDAPDRRRLMTGYWGVLILMVIAALFFAFEAAYSNVQAAIYASFGFDPALAGLLLSYYAIWALIAKPVLGFIHDKLGVVPLFVVFGVLYLAGLPLLAIVGGTGPVAFFLVLPIAALSLSAPTVLLPLIIVRSVGQERFPVIYGAVYGAFSLGIGLMLPLWGLFFDRTGSYTGAMVLAGGLGLVGLLVVIAGFLVGRRKLQAVASDAVPSPAA